MAHRENDSTSHRTGRSSFADTLLRRIMPEEAAEPVSSGNHAAMGLGSSLYAAYAAYWSMMLEMSDIAVLIASGGPLSWSFA